ncbi:hypothetical protein HMPREF1531_00817 [Propionibacterium sp. oral taxon 192 str. F0372]|uniref:TatD family hydrolase n=1 Tax=Propionibacterium sp. oral taxon 192 TaxID=671222 RepID=UPI000352AF39|nr:TatD family hydrolase [Propionibacterium sp. oral taxon 192]EPH06168.1 hypothetical protein HMPREF1531_00817 [Propionibacterium sp. oral taxon 192 str. F0372]
MSSEPQLEHGRRVGFEPIPIFDHHVHSDGRNADDYEWMALGGTTTVMVPCTSGEPHPSRRAFRARCRRLLHDEVHRAAVYGIDAYVALSVHPGDLADEPVDLDGLLDELAVQLNHDRARALGEISLRSGSSLEREVFVRQLVLAKELDLPVLVETSPDPKCYSEALPTYLELIKKSGVNPELISFMDMDADKWRPLATLGFGPAGVAVSPASDPLFGVRRKLTDTEVVRMLDEFSIEHFMLNTGFHFGSADPMGLVRVAHRLQVRHGMSVDEVHRLVDETARCTFLTDERNS